MNIEEFEEALSDILPDGFEIVIKNSGEVFVRTNLIVDDATAELVPIYSDYADDDPDPFADETDSYCDEDERD